MIEVNSRKLLSETNVGGHDYLRNLVQLPFYLQNSGLRKVKLAQKCSQQRKSFSAQMLERSDEVCTNIVVQKCARFCSSLTEFSLLLLKAILST